MHYFTRNNGFHSKGFYCFVGFKSDYISIHLLIIICKSLCKSKRKTKVSYKTALFVPTPLLISCLQQIILSWSISAQCCISCTCSSNDCSIQNTKLSWNGLKAQGQISTKRCVNRYCSRDRSRQLSALYRTYSGRVTVFGKTDKQW